MLVELVKINETNEWYCVKVDGATIPCRSGDYGDAKELFDRIITIPNYLTSREEILNSTIIN